MRNAGRTRPLTIFEFNDFINSLKSLGRSMLGYELEQDNNTLLGGERPVEGSIRIVGFLERAEDADFLVLAGHVLIIGCRDNPATRPGPGPRR